MIKCTCIFTALFCMMIEDAVFSAVYQVGPGKTYAKISDVPALTGGDIVEIYPNTYIEGRKWTSSGTISNPIIIRGVGITQPIIDGTGVNLSGEGAIPRALFQIEGSNYLIENLEFKNARNGNNGSGIRIIGDNITIRGCKVTYCDMGMQGGGENLLIEYCEVAFNGTSLFEGYSHNFYLGGKSTTVQYCYIHDSIHGQNFKTRCHFTKLLYNYIIGSNEGEVAFMDSDNTTPVNSNAVMIGNVIVSNATRTGNIKRFIAMGIDGSGSGFHNGTLYMNNNTLIANNSGNRFLLTSSTDAKIVAVNNIYYGSSIIVDSDSKGNISGYNNWISTLATIPSNFTNFIISPEPGFLSTGSKDYHLNLSSNCINAGFDNPTYIDGNGIIFSGVPVFEYVNHMKKVSRSKNEKLDLGVYEYGTALPGSSVENPFANIKVYPNPFRISDSVNKAVSFIDIPQGSTIEIFDICGNKIRTLTSAGYEICWDGKNETNEYVPFGMYPYLVFDTFGNKKKGKIGLIK